MLAGGCDGEPGEEMGPADGVHLGFLRWEVAVLDVESGSVAGWFEGDLDGADPGGSKSEAACPQEKTRRWGGSSSR